MFGIKRNKNENIDEDSKKVNKGFEKKYLE
jgi:hypothetical protein